MIFCELLCSTSNVTPLKQLTIPRLELCAATLLSKLYKKAIGALNLTINESYLWTDSSIVLTWIQGPSNKWKTFVGNRVAIIQEETASASWRHVPSQSNPADLISRGIQPSRPFLTTGVDYAGPILLRLGPPRSKTTTKGYIAIFVCFVTKAVHIEVVTSLTTEAFLAALRRFIARRGKPRTICPDNGTNFQGAANELHAVYKMLQSTSQMATVQDFLATEGCE